MDIWERLYQAAKKEYSPREETPFLCTHHVVSAIETEDGEIFTGFCMEGLCGTMELCAERIAAVNMYQHSGKTKVKRLIVFRDKPPYKGGGSIPCGACREFFYQCNEENENMEILVDFETRETTTLKELLPNWWGKERYEAWKKTSQN